MAQDGPWKLHWKKYARHKRPHGSWLHLHNTPSTDITEADSRFLAVKAWKVQRVAAYGHRASFLRMIGSRIERGDNYTFWMHQMPLGHILQKGCGGKSFMSTLPPKKLYLYVRTHNLQATTKASTGFVPHYAIYPKPQFPHRGPSGVPERLLWASLYICNTRHGAPTLSLSITVHSRQEQPFPRPNPHPISFRGWLHKCRMLRR